MQSHSLHFNHILESLYSEIPNNKQHDADTQLILVQVELLSGGVNMPVTPLNVYEYVRKYAEHRMLVVAEQPLHVSITSTSWLCILGY